MNCPFRLTTHILHTLQSRSSAIMFTWKQLFPAAVLTLIAGHTGAQVREESYRQFISNDINLKTNAIRYVEEVRTFYATVQYKPAWTTNPRSLQALLKLLDNSADLGLNEQDYQYAAIQSLKYKTGPNTGPDESIQTDVKLTDAAIHFFHDAAFGNTLPSLSYTGPDCRMQLDNIPMLLAGALSRNKLGDLLTELEPALQAYRLCKNKLIQFNEAAARHDFKEVTIISGKTDTSNAPLLIKLTLLGISDSIHPGITSSALTQIIKKAQQVFDLEESGFLNGETLRAFNMPLTHRIIQLKTCLNYMRWLNACDAFHSGIIVNLPAASLFTYMHGNLVLDSKVIAGKRSTPSPTLCSMIKEVVLYPYWHVPAKIVTRELLPHIKKNIGYLRENNFQVLNKQGSVINPVTVNWHALHAGYFPYIIRQSTGCDNSLGIVKFNFYNPFSVYLHDTPSKRLFDSRRRFFSHGCVRVQKAMELAHLLLKNSSAILDSLECKGCLPNQSPVIVPTSEPMQVTILYSPAWYNAAGEIRFYADVYQRSAVALPQ